VTTGLMTVIPPYWQTVAKGTVLVSAVALNHVLVQGKAKA
jgi:ribose/xylose/arabinose/galactoside ABC-type transport system permease subunit